MKRLLKSVFRSFAVEPVHLDRIGVNAERDIQRLAGDLPVRVIFDVGANLGQSASRYLQSFPLAHIHSFEPVSQTYELLQRQFSTTPRVTTYNFGFGDVDETATVHIMPSSGQNTACPVGTSLATERVTLRRLDGFLSGSSIETVDLLKIDVEGYESNVLRGAGTELGSGRFRFVYAECVLTDEQDTAHTSLFALHPILTDAGFVPFSYYAESFSLGSGAAMGNVLYAFRDLLPSVVRGHVRNIF